MPLVQMGPLDMVLPTPATLIPVDGGTSDVAAVHLDLVQADPPSETTSLGHTAWDPCQDGPLHPMIPPTHPTNDGASFSTPGFWTASDGPASGFWTTTTSEDSFIGVASSTVHGSSLTENFPGHPHFPWKLAPPGGLHPHPLGDAPSADVHKSNGIDVSVVARDDVADVPQTGSAVSNSITTPFINPAPFIGPIGQSSASSAEIHLPASNH